VSDSTRYSVSVVVDLAERLIRVYSGLTDPTYLIDRDGRVALQYVDARADLHEAVKRYKDQGTRRGMGRCTYAASARR